MVPVQETDDVNTKDPMQILEEGLTICKFGKFHLRLLAASLCSTVAIAVAATTPSFIIPVAECDLNMTIIQKGLLNGMLFFGQIGASLLAGFLTDAFGRKIILIWGNASLFLFSIIEGSSQTYWMLLFAKFLQGISFSLCYNAISTNLSELCPVAVRDRILILYTSFFSLGQIVTALFAGIVLPLELDYSIWKGYFEMHSWNIYLYVCSVWSLLAYILYKFIPESPKYLLSQAQEEAALEVLKSIYKENNGNKKDTFPILSFNSSGIVKPTADISLKKQIETALSGSKELFHRPLIFKLMLFTLITFASMIIFTSLRLWYPQISTIIENYSLVHDETARFCIMIRDYVENLEPHTVLANGTASYECIPVLSGLETYINGTIMGVVSLICVAITGLFVSCFGQRLLMVIMLIICTVCSTALYWTNSSLQIALLISITSGLLQTALGVLQNLFVRFFPTNLRALAVSLISMIGRIGSLVGNIIFPMLLELGCMGPFITVAVVSLGMASLIYLLPNVSEDNKETGDK